MYAYQAFNKRFNENSLTELFYEKVAGKQTVGRDYITSDLFSKIMAGRGGEIDIILRKVHEGSYKFTTYKQLLISKGKGKNPRELCIPTVRDQLTLAALSKVLEDVYQADCMTPQPQTVVSQVISILRSGQYTHCIKGDLKTFYASIPHEKLMKRLRRRTRKKELLALIESAIQTPAASIGESAYSRREEGVPEGLSISNRLANIYATALDELYQPMLGIKYFRYVDDILIFCDKQFASAGEENLHQHADFAGLKLNEGKSGVIELAKEALSYLGYLFDPCGKVTVRRSTVLQLERKLDNELRRMRNNPYIDSCLYHLNNRITGCRITEDGVNYERYGWLHYYSRIDDVGLLCHFDSLIEKLIRRYALFLPHNPKKFKKAFYEMKYKASTTNYIPTYDMRVPISEKREVLKQLFPMEKWDSFRDEEIDRLYSRRIRKMASKLEKDVGLIS